MFEIEDQTSRTQTIFHYLGDSNLLRINSLYEEIVLVIDMLNDFVETNSHEFFNEMSKV